MCVSIQWTYSNQVRSDKNPRHGFATWNEVLLDITSILTFWFTGYRVGYTYCPECTFHGMA